MQYSFDTLSICFLSYGSITVEVVSQYGGKKEKNVMSNGLMEKKPTILSFVNGFSGLSFPLLFDVYTHSNLIAT